ncbi:unnamed protein product [Phytophthora lilii]|uniref:Unnamed protein product n=1 Tax=Phytophthora lilii TaxID=2077276 RepID=A0A9W7CSD6_9STRA|nr:unnamed protein product [Phytophthora lilii]
MPGAKLKRAVKTGKLSLTSAELKGTGAILHLHPASYEKASRTRKQGRAVRLAITRHEINKGCKRAQGGSIWSSIWKTIKKGFKFAKDSGILSKVVDAAVPALAAAVGAPQAALPARGAIKKLTGVGVSGYESDTEGGRLRVSDLKRHASQTLRYTKKKGVLTDLADLAESKLKEHATKQEHMELISTVRRHVRSKYGVGVNPTAVPGKKKTGQWI